MLNGLLPNTVGTNIISLYSFPEMTRNVKRHNPKHLRLQLHHRKHEAHPARRLGSFVKRRHRHRHHRQHPGDTGRTHHQKAEDRHQLLRDVAGDS